MALNYIIHDAKLGVPQPVSSTATYATSNIPFPLGATAQGVDRQTGSAAPGGAGATSTRSSSGERCSRPARCISRSRCCWC